MSHYRKIRKPVPPPQTPYERVCELGERLDTHRKTQQSLHPDLTMTGMYNVLEKLKSGEPLTPKESVIRERGQVDILKRIHDELDLAVFACYGWPPTLTDEEILQRLVALNAERAAEERRGLIRWLRPEYQIPLQAQRAERPASEPELEKVAAEKPVGRKPWPKTILEQSKAIYELMRSAKNVLTVDWLAGHFSRANRSHITDLLESFTTIGRIRQVRPGEYESTT